MISARSDLEHVEKASMSGIFADCRTFLLLVVLTSRLLFTDVVSEPVPAGRMENIFWLHADRDGSNEQRAVLGAAVIA